MNPFLLFDFDGTVANSIDGLFELVNGLAPRYGYQPISRQRFEQLRDYPLARACRMLKVPLYKLGQAVPIILHEYRKIIPNLDPCPGIVELLDTMKSRRIPMALLSSNRADNVQAFLDNHGIGHFDWVEGTGGLLHKHRSIVSRLRKHGLMRENVIYIGDEARDIKAARKSGVKVISVCWGLHSRQNLESHKPDHIAQTPNDVWNILEKHYLGTR